MTGMGLFCIMILKCLSLHLDAYKCEVCMIHVACRNAYRSLGTQREETILETGFRMEDNIKFIECELVDRVHVSLDRVQYWALVNMKTDVLCKIPGTT